MSGQMYWLSSPDNEGQRILHLRERSFDPWLPYTAFPQYKVPDYLIPGGSKGWSTYQKLRQAGWTLIPTAQSQNTFVLTADRISLSIRANALKFVNNELVKNTYV